MSTKNQMSIPEGINQISRFVEKNGRLPFVSAKNREEKRLATWYYHIKSNGNTLSDVHHKRLSAIPGWKWDFLDERDFFAHANAFESFTKTNFYLPKNMKTTPIDEKNLYTWRSKVIEHFDRLPTAFQQKIQSLPYWTPQDFDTFNTPWENTYFHYYDFITEHHRPPIIDNGKEETDLAKWANQQRKDYCKSALDVRQIYLLERIPFWFWKNEDYQPYSYDDLADQLQAWIILRGTAPRSKTLDPIERSLAVFASFYGLATKCIPSIKTNRAISVGV